MPPTVAACGRTHEEARARAERRASALGLKEFKVQTYLFNRKSPPILATLPAAEREAIRKRKAK